MAEFMNRLFKDVVKEGFSADCFPDYEIFLHDLYHLELDTQNSNLYQTFNPFTCQPTGFAEVFETNQLTLNPSISEKEPNQINEESDINLDKIKWPTSLDDIYNLTCKDQLQTNLYSDNLNEIQEFKGIQFETKDNSWLQSLQLTVDIIKIHEIYEQDNVFEILEKETDIPNLEIQDRCVKINPKVNDLIWAEAVADKSIEKKMETFKLAFDFEFKLDTFQMEAIYHMEQRHNVFVSAHTSAGKTVIADYAIALSKQHMTKVIYTSPIKALSNQKYREFKKKFVDVGIITGDVQIASSASCLVMTTEILRSMLYFKSQVIGDLEWVIFDEVHYINDSERGVVWEEVFIMLPKNINIVMLSATVPNVMDLAEWIGFTRMNKVYVVSTLTRPIPLEHYIFNGCTEKSKKELFLILKADKSMNLKGYKDAIKDKKCNTKKAPSSRNDAQLWRSLIYLLETKNKMPSIVFTFSKRKINETVESLMNIDLLSSTEKSRVITFFNLSIKKLKSIDKELPQVILLRSILTLGIGVHHSGVLPILKEIVEILFQAGLVKILFATETFSMGVNMPARTVIFESHRKHDGSQMRDLLPGEYIQMAGRAGRRGLDDTGTVIIMFKNDIPEISDLSIMMTGKPVYLQSQFRITYAMILKLFHNESMQMIDMMKHSFIEFHNQKNITNIQKQFMNLCDKENKQTDIIYKDDLSEYYDACEEWIYHKDIIKAKILSNPHVNKLLTPGRIVIITEPIMYLSAIIIDSLRDNNYMVLINEASLSDTKPDNMLEMPFPHYDEKISLPLMPIKQKILTIHLKNILYITNKLLKINANILSEAKKKPMQQKSDMDDKNNVALGQQLLKYVQSQNEVISSIDPIKDLQIKQDLTFMEHVFKLKLISSKLDSFHCLNDPYFRSRFEDHRTRMMLRKEISRLKHLLSDECLMLHPQYLIKLNVLRRLKHLNDSDEVLMKGKIASEMSNNELVLTELIVEGILSSMSDPALAAILSCIVFKEKRCMEPMLNPELVECKAKFVEIVSQLGAVQKACGLATSSDIFLEQFTFGLMQVVYEWAKGESFKCVLMLTDVQEGVIVRCMQQLHELMRDVRKASIIVGDPILANKMEQVMASIKRDIVFTPSLYTNPETEFFFKT